MENIWWVCKSKLKAEIGVQIYIHQSLVACYISEHEDFSISKNQIDSRVYNSDSSYA